MRVVSIEFFFKLVNGLCVVAFFLQIGFLLLVIIYPEELNTISSQHKLSQIDFPVLFKLCAVPGFNHSKLVEFGYQV